MHTHRSLKPYKCCYCDYRCNLSGNCRKHIKQKHKGREVKWIKVADASDETRDKVSPKVEDLAQSFAEDALHQSPLYEMNTTLPLPPPMSSSDIVHLQHNPMYSDPSKTFHPQHALRPYGHQEVEASSPTRSHMPEQPQSHDRGIAAVVEKIYKSENQQTPLVPRSHRDQDMVTPNHQTLPSSHLQDPQGQPFFRLPLPVDPGATSNIPSFGQGFTYMDSGLGFSVYPTTVTNAQTKTSEVQYTIM